MKKKTNRRLQLRKQALRQLDRANMSNVQGGTELRLVETGACVNVLLTADCGGCWFSYTSHTGGADYNF